jgi:HK97 family phage prohead protease
MPVIQLEQKRLNAQALGPGLEWKVVDADQGIIKGYLAVFNNIDSYKDRIRPGAFKKTIADAIQRKDTRGKKYLWPLLWMHDPEKPIGGFIDATEDKIGLLVTAQLDISGMNPLALSVFSGFKAGYIDELSIGYKALQKSYDGDGVRDLLEIQNFEGSAVTMNFAANELAQVTSVKTQGKKRMDRKDFNDHYRQQCIQDWMYGDFQNLVQALQASIMDIFAIGDEPQADVVNTILNGAGDGAADTGNTIGFIDALKMYVQKGIALNVSNYMQQNGGNGYGYMFRPGDLSSKTGAVVSQQNSQRLQGHINTIEQVKDMLGSVSDDMARYITGGPAYDDAPGDANVTGPNSNTEKTRRIEPSYKTLTSEQPSTDTVSDEEAALAQLIESLRAA